MINISEIEIKKIEELLFKFRRGGMVLHFSTFQIEKNYLGELTTDEYLKHLTVARQSLEKIHYQANFHWNKVSAKDDRNSFPSPRIDHTELSNSGKKIGLEEFLGPFYDLEKKKPIIRGVIDGTSNCHFYPDNIEKTENDLKIQSRIADFNKKLKNDNASGVGFMHALMEPPYSIRIGNNIQEKGGYVSQLMDELFDDLNELSIFKWSTDCSTIFDAGKEWWGCFFWTVYNPKKNIYIGIIGSSTD